MSEDKEGYYIGTAKVIGSCDSVCYANLESAFRNAPLEAKKGPRFDSPVRITVVSYRQRLCDADGVSAKAAIDGIVHSGVLTDDSPQFVKEVRYQQVKVKSKEEEQTQIIIEEIAND